MRLLSFRGFTGTIHKLDLEDAKPSCPFAPALRLAAIGMLTVVPVAVFLRITEHKPGQSRQPLITLSWGAWAIVALWLVLGKGLNDFLKQENGIFSSMWLLLGLVNLIASIAAAVVS